MTSTYEVKIVVTIFPAEGMIPNSQILVKKHARDVSQILTALGEEGWELRSVAQNGLYTQHYLVRKK